MKLRINLLILVLILGLTSCSSIIGLFYGMKNLKKINENTIVRFSKKYDVSQTDNYELDTSYVSFLFSFDTTKYKEQVKNHYQPLQALYYDKKGQLISFQINCYAGGFPNLHWNRDNIMTTFPPQQQAPVDSIIPLDIQLKYLRPLSRTNSFSIKNYDYIIFVYWNIFMGRQSKRLIHSVQENCKLSGDKKVKIIYVNTDNFFKSIGKEKNYK